MTDTRELLTASLAVTPPAEASRKIRRMVVWGEIADALNRARKAVTKRNLDAIHTWMARAALHYIELKDGQEIDVLQATLSELSSPTLARELERRAKEGETPAVRAEATRILKRLGKIAQPKSVKAG